MTLQASPRKILNSHIALISLLLLANILSIINELYFGKSIPILNFNEERNIPTFFSSFALIICSALLYLIAINNKKTNTSYIPWFGLSFIFLFLSIDETLTVHEKITEPTREVFEASGFLFYAWVIPYGIALIIFIAAYAKFLFYLPRNIMLLFLASGFTFVSGAIGFELLGGYHAETFGENNVLYYIYYTCEEFLEMLGIAILLYTLLTHMENQSQTGALTLVVSSGTTA
ncbi:hypothetical protein [uncultured Microbulbifer sp.]|mgnify:CR=1 FL=1|uniref:hypothetical protein n=1 Tax=uncultured Microbulbifer sp. TaxID=348147 RepID=UPI0025FE264D|nr:hypothetical protein [uncultured Microbulbifer sp.]